MLLLILKSSGLKLGLRGHGTSRGWGGAEPQPCLPNGTGCPWGPQPSPAPTFWGSREVAGDKFSPPHFAQRLPQNHMIPQHHAGWEGGEQKRASQKPHGPRASLALPQRAVPKPGPQGTAQGSRKSNEGLKRAGELLLQHRHGGSSSLQPARRTRGDLLGSARAACTRPRVPLGRLHKLLFHVRRA